ncbi:12882_t:CDS:2 [Gigaspora margarita]|uniref:12882_t:CDS:1 n=1 Tax=Gigaspora margarita TaxID=4874 RepID=A0ABN7V9H9_GIGMA|nr:12882_t:CDS:2 [Gigaspora margarita]
MTTLPVVLSEQHYEINKPSDKLNCNNNESTTKDILPIAKTVLIQTIQLKEVIRMDSSQDNSQEDSQETSQEDSQAESSLNYFNKRSNDNGSNTIFKSTSKKI